MAHLPSDKNELILWFASVYGRCRKGDPSGWADLEAGITALVEQRADDQRRRDGERAARMRDWEDALRAEIEQVKNQRDRALDELRQLRKEAREAPPAAPAPTPTARTSLALPKTAPPKAGPPEAEAIPPTAPFGSLPEAVVDHRDAATVGTAFASWCREAGPGVSERAAFAARLAEAVPGATVRPVYRDRDSARLPVVFADDEGRSPAEYWTVEGAGGPWLLPFPQGPRQFRDLADGVFLGDRVAPRDLGRCRPAALEKVGSGWKVSRPGFLE